jgi:hypothetical protein
VGTSGRGGGRLERGFTEERVGERGVTVFMGVDISLIAI